MKHFFWIFVAIYASVMMVACNKNSGGDPAVIGGTCITYTVNGCLDANGALVTNGGYYNGAAALAYFADNWSQQRTITITDPTTYKNFLRTSMGVCDAYSNTGGTASCSTWVNGGLDLVITPDPSLQYARITVRAWPQYNQGYSYAYQFPDLQSFALSFLGVPPQQNVGVYRNPMVLDPNQVIAPINNSAGFELRYTTPIGSFAPNSLIQVRVEQGHMGDNSFTFKLGYPNCISNGGTAACQAGQGTWFAQGTFTRCVTPGCTGGMF